MRMSQLVGRRYKERPAEAVLDSHAFLLRGGYIRHLTNGIFSILPPGLRVLRKIENIIRDEMNRISGQEVQMPLVQTKELWEESGRYDNIDSSLVRFKDRSGHDLVLAMTHEEAVLHLFRNEITSHRDLPFMVYQIQTKFRDEEHTGGGLIRVREFTMKDAYSFHKNPEILKKYYHQMEIAYRRIFALTGIPEVVMAESDPGIMGGDTAHEFILLSAAGEDKIACCPSCGRFWNISVAPSCHTQKISEKMEKLKKVSTPDSPTIEKLCEFLKITPDKTAKVVFYENDASGKLVIALIRGDLEVNEDKIARIIRTSPQKASETKIRASGAVPGYASPLGISIETCTLIVDQSILTRNNMVTGANEAGFHLINFNPERDLSNITVHDIATVRENDSCPHCSGKISIRQGIELGNIFQLGTEYTGRMGMRYLDDQGKEMTPVMGCYGIGIGRLLSSIIEARKDEHGPVWPVTIAPWHVHVSALKVTDAEVACAAVELYDSLQDSGIEVIFDDRNERPGVQFAEADLLGIPFRLIVSDKHIRNGMIEWKYRETGETGLIKASDAAVFIRQKIGMAWNQVESEADRFLFQS